MIKKARKFLWVIFLFLLMYGFVWFLYSLITIPDLRQTVEGAGIWGPALMIGYFVLGHVVAPVSGTPGGLVGLALFEFEVFFLLYIAYAISAPINFAISRYLGRRWVEKIGGKGTLEGIDKMLEKTEYEMLVLGRIVGFPLFDVISYAAGFTNMSFKRYYSITMFCAAIPLLVFAFLVSQIGTSFEAIMFILVLTIIFSAVYVAHAMKKASSKRRKK